MAIKISQTYYNQITNSGTPAPKIGSYITRQQPATFINNPAPNPIKATPSKSAAQKAEEDRKIEESKRALADSQQRLAEQTQAMNSFAVNDQADYAQKDVFKTAVEDLSKKSSAELATLKTYVIPQKYADVKRGTTPIETWNLNFDIGRLQQDQSKARAVAITDPTPENIKLADTLKKTQDEYIAKNRDAMYYTDSKGVEKARGNVITSVFANYVPQLIDQIVANIPAMALSVGAGLLTGGAYTAAEIAAMTTTQLATRAAAIGLTSNVAGAGASAIAGWNQSYDVTRGASYDNLIALGVPADRAKAISADEAFWSSLIEMSDNVLDWSLLGFGKVAGAITQLGTGVAADIVAKTGKEVVVKSAMRKMVDVLAKYGVNILSEGAQEWTQEGLSIRGEKTGLGAARAATAAEDLQRQNAAFQGGAQIAAITGGASLAGTSVATNLINRVNQDTITTPTSKPTTPAIVPVANTGNNATVTTPVTTLPLTNTVAPKVVENPSEGKIERVKSSVVQEQTIVKDSVGNAVTPEQISVLKDSKVKDDKGNPLVVYHGTDKNFTEFRVGEAEGWGKGIYLTDNIENAKEYGKNLVSAYVNIKNPFNGEYTKEFENTEAFKKYSEKYGINDGYELYSEYGDFAGEAIRELGYDGIIAKNSNNIEGYEVVAFSPDQIIPMMDLQMFADKTNKFAKTVLDDHDSDMEPQALVDGLSDVYEAVYNARKDNDPTTKEYAETLADSLAKEILGRTRSSFVTENDSAKQIRDWLKKIYIIPTHVAQEDLSTFKQKFKRIKFASDAMIEKGGANVLGIDVVYGELVSEYPDLFDKTQQDPTGMLRDIVTASNEITATKGKYLLSEAEINQHAPELAKSLLDSYDDVSSYSTDEEKIAAKNRRSDALEQEFFGRKISQMDSQMLKKKFEVARTKLLARFNREKAEIRSLAKDRQIKALDTLSKKYDAKIDSLNSMLDSEKYTNFWKSELDKKELRGRIDTLRADKNAQIDQMKKAFSEKLKTTKKQATLNKATAISKVKGIYAANKKAAQVRLAERKEINKKLSDLRKVDMKHMRPEYQKRIQAIFDAFDITAKKHTTTKLNALNALQKYISDNPDHSIPEYKLKELAMLSKKTASQITKEEFNSIHDAVMHLVTLEQLKDQLIMNGKYRANSEAVAEGVTNVTKGRRVTTDPLVVDTSKPEFANKLFSKPMEFIDNHFTPETLVLKSDQKKNGITKQIVFDAMYAGYSNVLDFKQQADKIFSPFLKGLGGDLRNWSRSVNKNLKSSELVEVPISKQANQTVQKIRVTKAERIYLYLGSFDTDIRRSMLKGGISFKNNLSQIIHLTESDIDTINSSLTADEKKFSDLTNQYFKWAGVKLNEVFLKLNGYELVQSDKNYLPKETHPDTIQRDFLKMKNKSINASIEGMGFLKERTKTSNAVVVDDIFRVIIGHMEEASAYYGYAEPLRNAKMFLGDPNLKNAYRKVGMNNVLQQLNKYVADIEEKSIDMDFVEKLSYSMQSKFSTAALGGNVFTILKQPSSYILEANEIPAQYLLKAIATKSTLDEIRKYSPILTDRIDGNVSMEMGDIGKIARVRELFGNYRDWPQKLTKGISAADRMIVGKTWNAVKMMFKAENPSITQEELMTKTARKVEEVIRHTNSAATIHDRSQIGRSRNFFTKAMTIFTSQTNIMFNSATQAVLELNYSDHKVKDFATATKKLATIYILANMYEQSIDRLRKKATGQDDQPWNVIQDWIGGMLDGIYFVGKAVKVYQSRVEYGKYFGYDFSIPPLQIAEQGINFAVDVATMIEQRATQEVYKSGEKKGSIKWLQTLNALKNETFSIVARLNGLPYDNLVKLFDIVTNKQ